MTLRLAGSTSGYTEIDAPAVAGSNTLVLPTGNGSADQALVTNGSGTLSFADRGRLVQGTAQNSTSGTSIDFTGIPSWVKRVTVTLSEVSLSGTSTFLFQVGAGSIATTGYNSGAVSVSVSTSNTTSGAGSNTTTGITSAGYTGTAGSTAYGHVVFTNVTGNTWVATGALYVNGALRVVTFGGGISLSGTLDRVRITTVNGTDTFDAGSINILYEG